MELKDLFDILNKHQSLNLDLWNLYAVVALGLLSYVIGSEKAKGLRVRIILAIAFSVFAYGNAIFIDRNQTLINGFAKEISENIHNKSSSPNLKNTIEKWEIKQPKSIMKVHLPFDALVVLVLIFGPCFSRRPHDN